MRDLRARAKFKVKLTTVGNDVRDGVRWTKAGRTAVRVSVGIKNEGDKAAGETLINALVPAHLENVRWAGPGGQATEEPKMTTPTEEKLTGSDGTEYDAKFLSRTVPRVGPGQFAHHLERSGDPPVRHADRFVHHRLQR